MSRISKVLIANRGEIACRVMRTAQQRGVSTVAVYSDADANALHVRMADEAVRIGGPAPADIYLKIDAIIEAARRTGADAVHPGYGFLAERADFAEACALAGLIFIGPPAAAIAAMGDKAAAKRLMIAAGVPTIPGYQDEDQSDARLIKAAQELGLPVMLKASAGGGGRGQRVVADASDLASAIVSARRESLGAFGDDRLIVEKAVAGARHVEIQIIADGSGKTLHLGERDCSLQRRRQKVIEEAPSPVVTPELRAAMGAAAVEAARAVGYRSVGTVEFLVEPDTGAFYFLEMNTRIQVEHPVTEMVTGLDLVDLQFDIAEGQSLPIEQDDVCLSGWAIEARLYAEDAARGFLPQTGVLTAFDTPPGVRVDTGVEAGDAVSPYYDPMIAKIIAHAPTREAAIGRLAAAIDGTAVLGVVTNAPFLIAALRHPAFTEGRADIGFIESNLDQLNMGDTAIDPIDVALAAVALSEYAAHGLLAGWQSREGAATPLRLRCGDEDVDAAVVYRRERITATLAGAMASIEIMDYRDGVARFLENGHARSARLVRNGSAVDIKRTGVPARRLVDITYEVAGESGSLADIVRAPMAGAITSVLTTPGASVKKGQAVATIEAMKMEQKLISPRDGVVSTVSVSVGDQVTIRAAIITLERGD